MEVDIELHNQERLRYTCFPYHPTATLLKGVSVGGIFPGDIIPTLPLGMVLWHISYEWQSLLTSAAIPSQLKSTTTLPWVFFVPRCPPEVHSYEWSPLQDIVLVFIFIIQAVEKFPLNHKLIGFVLLHCSFTIFNILCQRSSLSFSWWGFLIPWTSN